MRQGSSQARKGVFTMSQSPNTGKSKFVGSNEVTAALNYLDSVEHGRDDPYIDDPDKESSGR